MSAAESTTTILAPYPTIADDRPEYLTRARAMKGGWLSDRALRLAFGAAILILLVTGVFSYRSIVASGQSSVSVDHTRDVLKNLQLMRLEMETAASGIRGYLITGKEAYLETYNSGKSAAKYYGAVVRSLTADNPVQQLSLASSEILVAERFERSETDIALSQAQGRPAAAEAIRVGGGQRLPGELDAVVQGMQVEAERVLAARNADAALRVTQTKINLLVGIAVGLLTTIGAGWLVRLDRSRRAIAEETLRESERRYRMLIDRVGGTAILMPGPLGEAAAGIPKCIWRKWRVGIAACWKRRRTRWWW